LMPQQVYHLKDYRVKGRSSEEEQIIIDDLLAVQESGAFSVVIEAVPKTLADKLCKMSKIKTIGIGASNKCDGQILVTEDMLGFFDKNPKFVKKYAFLKNLLAKSVQNYKSDVISRKFPTKKNLY